ncbi:MAG: hypothetical protein KI790_03750 [Cyclobacteriaceae bacterium]|nr:hypothetical protein [Cyclobacteriaceae bacterium HetDA_MAG_MS6]
MRKFFSFTLTLSMLFLTGVVFGQGYTFRVLANKGQNQVKKAGSSEAVALKTGATLNAEDELIISQGAYIGLMHKTGKTIEVREAGSKKVSELEKKVAARNTSVASRYAQFIANKMNEGEKANYRARMNATGAVSRATGSAAINVMLPSSVDVLSDNAVVRWSAPENAPEDITYVVTVMNIFDEVVLSEETGKTSFDLDFATMKDEAGLYIFNVKQKGDDEVASGNFGIKKVNPTDRPEVSENLAGLQSEVAEDSPLNKLIYASFFEENGLVLDALTKYEEAIKLSPGVQDFQDLYESFLIKNNLAQ